MADYNIKGEMTLATGSFVASAKQASDSLNRLNTSAKTTGGGIDLLGGVMKKLAVGALATFIVKLGRDSVQAAQTAGAAQNRLRMLLLATGGATEDQIKILNQQAAALENMTVVSKDNITVVQSQLATFDLGSKAIATMTPAILDYVVAEKGAKASADEYRQMTNGLALALNGQFGALTRVGFVLDAKTKADIKSGTEMERAAAIVRVLNSTYKDFASTAGDTAAGAQQKLGVQINNLKQSFGEMLLPTIQKVQGFMATKLLPIINGLMEKFKDGSAIKKFIDFVGSLLKNLFDFGSAIASIIGPVITDILVPAFMLAGAAVVGMIRVLGKVGTFLKEHQGIMVAVSAVIAGAAMGFIIFNAALFAHAAILKIVKGAQIAFQVVQTIMTGGQLAQIASTNTLAASMLRLNAIMSANPIGLIVAAIAVLAAAFVVAWNHSETFRKVVIAVGKAGIIAFGYIIEWVGKLVTGVMMFVSGPMRLLLKGLSMLKVPGTKNALEAIENGIKSTGNFFDKAAESVKGYADKLDGLENKKIKLPSMSIPKMPKGNPADYGYPDISGLDPGVTTATGDDKKNKAAAKLAAQLADLKSKLKETLQGYNDFIANDFAVGFINGTEKARDTILKGLDEAKKVFDAQAAIFEAKGDKGGLSKVENAFTALNEKIRAMIPEAMRVAGELEAVQAEVAKAKEALDAAIKDREEGAAAFAQMLAKPFGEPSELNNALSSAEASVSSIISMYDRIKDAIEKRYAGIDPSGKNALIQALENQTQQLVDLARQRDAVSKELAKAQNALEDAIASRKQGSATIADILESSFGTPTELAKAMSGAEATSDSIINMYKKIKDAINARYAGIAEGGKNAILQSLENQTQKLLDLVKRRDAASKVLAEAQKHLEDVLTKQSEMKTSVTGSMKSYATALANISSGNSANTIKVIKTATGMVITQMESGSKGVQTITEQLKNRLQTIKDFSANIQALLAKGLSKEYVQQLLNAGPEAAGETAKLLASSGADQINTINQLYADINTESEKFGTQMADTFYGNSVAMAQAMVAGAESEYNAIVAEMTRITDGISIALSPLSVLGSNLGTDLAQGYLNSIQAKYDEIMAKMKLINDQIAVQLEPLKTLGTKVGTDLAQGLYDALKAKEASLIALAKSIAETIAMYMAQAMASIGAMQASQAQAAATAAAAAQAAANAAAAAASAAASASTSFTAPTNNGLFVGPIPVGTTRTETGYITPPPTTVNTNTLAGIYAASGFNSSGQPTGNTTVQSGAVQVTINSNVPTADIEPIMTRALIGALSAR